MAYQINRSNGDLLVTVNDNQIVDSVSSIKFLGRTVQRYGEIEGENILHLLENFASSSEPAYPLLGQLWYDTSISKMKFCINESGSNKWKTIPVINIIQPSTPEVGEMWWNGTVLYVYSASSTWVKVGPDDSSLETLVGNISTNDTVPTAVYNIPILDNNTYLVNYRIIARDSISKIDHASFILNVSCYRADSGNVIVVGSENIETVSKTSGAADSWTTELSGDGTNLKLTVSGSNGTNTIVWKVAAETFRNG